MVPLCGLLGPYGLSYQLGSDHQHAGDIKPIMHELDDGAQRDHGLASTQAHVEEQPAGRLLHDSPDGEALVVLRHELHRASPPSRSTSAKNALSSPEFETTRTRKPSFLSASIL